MGFRILIADDEFLIRNDLKELLEEMGHEVVAEAADGQAALESIARKKPDLVILDIKMPGLDGIDVAKGVGREYPVIILTAYSERNLINRARDAGVMAYLTKPFRVEDLSPAIELAVNHFLQKSELSDRVSGLKEELEKRKVVEMAKGLLMKSERLSEMAAYRRIQKISMTRNKPMKEVAEAIIMMLE
jgi:two-component system, response regulator PdtaR